MTRLPHLPLMTIVLAAVLLVGGYLTFTTGRYVIHNYQARQEERDLRTELVQLERDHDELVSVRDYLKSDEYIEYVARRTLGLVFRGETLVVVSGNDPVATPTSDEPRGAGTPSPVWWRALFPEAIAYGAGATPTPAAR